MDSPIQQKAIRFKHFVVKEVNFIISSSPTNLPAETIHINISVDVVFFENDVKNYTVNLIAEVESASAGFKLRVVSNSLFESEDPITPEFMDSDMARVSSPAIAFPFLRSFINTLTTNAGIPPLVLPAFNFTKPELTKPRKETP